MKKLKAGHIRTTSLLSPRSALERLHTFKDFPVFMGCTDAPQKNDIVADMVWDICKKTGLIQLRKLLPLEVLYMDQHNDGTGKVWKDHYAAFAKFLYKYKPKNILEIGGAHDQIAQNFWKFDPRVKWTTVEPNPQHITSDKIRVIKAWFDESFTIDAPIDTVIHSHVFEHAYEPIKFIEHIGRFLKKGERHIFTFPNLLAMLEKKWTNCLNFEHTAFLTEEITDYVLKKEGFIILEKQYYGHPHSIFYATEKSSRPKKKPSVPNKYKQYKTLYKDYITYHLDMIKGLNSQMKRCKDPVYLFGAHIFSQTLIQFGLKTDSIVSILDNSPLKQGKRLYGTNFFVHSPEILRGKGKVKVILKAGTYNEEIAKQVLQINSNVEFW